MPEHQSVNGFVEVRPQVVERCPDAREGGLLLGKPTGSGLVRLRLLSRRNPHHRVHGCFACHVGARLAVQPILWRLEPSVLDSS